jgi:4-hydroxybenzoate polyprenyltransferase
VSDGLVRSQRQMVWVWVGALRPAHWIKNVLVAAPMVFGHASPTPWLIWHLAVAFAICSLAASAGYVLNDYLDREADGLHGSKRNRPIALGLIHPSHALLAAAALGFGALILAQALFSPVMTALVAVYLLLTASYSRWLKRLPVVDVCVLAGLFALRLLVGGVASDIAVSAWLMAFGCSLFLSLALAKRLDEAVAGAARGVQAMPGRPYRSSDATALRIATIATASVALAILVAYVGLRAGEVNFYRRPGWLWVSVVLLALWLTNMFRRAASGRLNGDPVVVAASDPMSLMLAAGVAATLTVAV